MPDKDASLDIADSLTTITLRTRKPKKWHFLDTETGEAWRWDEGAWRHVEDGGTPEEPAPEPPAPPGEAFTADAVRELVSNVRGLLAALAEDERARTLTASAVSVEDWNEIWPRVASSGVSTPGCNCEHEDMGVLWHRDWCDWKSGLRR